MRDLITNLPQPTPYDYRIIVVSDGAANAFAMLAGSIVLNTGLFDALKTPEQLAFVLAHEIQHVEHRHGLKTFFRQLSTGAIIGMIFGIAQDSGSMTVDALLNLKYSRDMENEADVEGVRLMARVGVSPVAAVEALEAIGNDESGWVPSVIRSHPSDRVRIGRILMLPEYSAGLPATRSE